MAQTPTPIPLQAPATSPTPAPTIRPLVLLAVDLDEVLRDCQACLAVRALMVSENRSLTELLEPKQRELLTLQETLRRERASLEEAEYRRRRDGLAERFRLFQAEFDQQRSKLGDRNRAAVARIRQTAQEVIIQIASERGAALVLSLDQVVWAQSALNITAETIKRLNQRFPPGSPDPAQTPP